MPLRLPLLVLGLLLLLAAPASAATFTVTTTADAPTGGCDAESCSLREAAQEAAVAAGSTIVLPAGRFVVSEGELVIASDELSIIGAGTRQTVIDAEGSSRVFRFPGTTSDAVVRDLTITGGNSTLGDSTPQGDGGAVISFGRLTLERVALTDSVATFGGGGISTATQEFAGTTPELTLIDSTVSGNRVGGEGVVNGQGGGVLAAGKLTLRNTTVSGNAIETTGTAEGGGVASTASTSGGIILLPVRGGPATPTTVLDNTTIAGNTIALSTGDGAGLSGQDPSGGEFVAANRTEARNTIIAANTVAGTENACAFLSVTVSVNNLAGDDSCAFDDAGSQESADAQLRDLADAGGPVDTRLPALRSPARDAGDAATCLATDARGVTRPKGARCDIGAVELAPATATTNGAIGVTPTAATITGFATNPAPQAGDVRFQFGTTTAYGTETAAQALAAGADVPASAALTGLAPGTTYHYRVVARNADGGEAFGDDATFTTAAAPVAPPAPGAPPAAAPPAVDPPCGSRRVLRITVRDLTRRSVRVTFRGRTLRTTGTRFAVVRLDLRRLRPARYTVTITGRTASGRRVRRQRSYRTCLPPSRSIEGPRGDEGDIGGRLR